MTHVPPQKTSFLAYFPHSAGFSPACKRPEFVKKSHFLDETTSTETTSYLKNENNFSLLWSLQMTKVLCGRALDSAIAPNRGIALLGPKKWRKIDPMISILGDPSLFVRPYIERLPDRHKGRIVAYSRMKREAIFLHKFPKDR